jgi:hypothetical protein
MRAPHLHVWACANVHHVLAAVEEHGEAEVCAGAVARVQGGVHQGLVQVQHQRLLLARARLARQQGLAAGRGVAVDGAQAADEGEGVKVVLVILQLLTVLSTVATTRRRDSSAALHGAGARLRLQGGRRVRVRVRLLLLQANVLRHRLQGMAGGAAAGLADRGRAAAAGGVVVEALLTACDCLV